MDSLDEVLLFARVVQAKSFSGAARELHVSTSAVSKAILRLEKRLGARLLNRSTRRLSLTEVGLAYYSHCEKISAEMEAANLTVSQMSSQPSGVLRVTAPVMYGVKYVTEVSSQLVKKYSKLYIETIFDDQIVNMIDGNFDVAIRIGKVNDKNVVARPIASIRRIVCGSPSYFSYYKKPVTIEDLSAHNCLSYSFREPKWCFKRNGSTKWFSVSGSFTSNSALALLQASIKGLGLVWLPAVLVEDEIRLGRLVPVLNDFSFSSRSIYALYLHRYQLSPKIRVFVDALVTSHLSTSTDEKST